MNRASSLNIGRPLVTAVALLAISLPLTSPASAAGAQQRIIFSADFSPGHSQLFVANADGSGERALLPQTGMDYSPSYSADGRWIVFTSERNGSADVYRVRPDGSGLEALTDDPAYDDQAALSPDGRTLAFVSSRGTGRAHVWLMDVPSHRVRLLTKDSGSDFRPSWSPDGQWLAFTSDRNSSPGHLPDHWERMQSLGLYIIHPDGSGERLLTRGRGVAGSPRWSADGKHILYYEATELAVSSLQTPGAYVGPVTQIVSLDVAAGTTVQLTKGTGFRLWPQTLPDGSYAYLERFTDHTSQLRWARGDDVREGPKGIIRNPSWSSDGRQVVYEKYLFPDPYEVLPAFSRRREFSLTRITGGVAMPVVSPRGDQVALSTGFVFDTLMVMTTDGSGRRTLLSRKGSMLFPSAWSPDGRQIAFSSGTYFRAGEHASGQLNLIAPDASGLQSVATDGTNDGFGSWSPDGRRMVYKQDHHLVIQSLADQTRINLTPPGAQHDNFPQWSPKGDWIAFTSDRDGDEQFRIYLIRPDGTGLHQLTDSPGDAHCAWSPDGQWLIFSSARMGFKDEYGMAETPQPHGELFVIRVNGTGLLQLTDNQWEDGNAAWIPERSPAH